MALLCFILMVYGLSFLAADARIFGVDTVAYKAVLHNDDAEPTERGRAWIRSIGIIPLRQQVLKVRLIREHLSCYFCMGVWAGPLAHWILMRLNEFGPPWQTQDYFLNHPDTGLGWLYGCVAAFLIGASGSYVLNALVLKLEEE